MKNNQGGFVRLIILIIIVFVIAQFMGYDPVEFANKFLIPAFTVIWNLFVILLDWLVESLREAYTTTLEVIKSAKK